MQYNHINLAWSLYIIINTFSIATVFSKCYWLIVCLSVGKIDAMQSVKETAYFPCPFPILTHDVCVCV